MQKLLDHRHLLAIASAERHGDKSASVYLAAKLERYKIVVGRVDAIRIVKQINACIFVGLVFHGYKSFAGSAINLAGDFNNSILKTVENGANLFFLLSYDNTEELKANYGEFEYYSIRYDIWYDDMVQTYKVVNKILKPVMNAIAVSHDFTAFRVVEMTYDNGVTITLDYNTSVITVNDGTAEFAVDLENDTVTTNEGVVTIAEFVKD